MKLQRNPLAPQRPQAAAKTWPGAHYGVREPDPQEVALSWDEVHHGVRFGILTETPESPHDH